MKRMTNTMITAAAVLMIGAGVASAQTALKAEVPFAFSAGGKVTEQGKYVLHMLRGNVIAQSFSLYNETTRRSYMLTAMRQSDAPKNWKASGTARAAFDCSTGVCVLRKIWFGEGYVYEFRGPKAKSGEMQLTEILLKSNTTSE
jgi:hypothetical protein